MGLMLYSAFFSKLRGYLLVTFPRYIVI